VRVRSVGSTQNEDHHGDERSHDSDPEQHSQSACTEPTPDRSRGRERRVVVEESRSPDQFIEPRRLRTYGVDVSVVVRFGGLGHERNVLRDDLRFRRPWLRRRPGSVRIFDRDMGFEEAV
jgi:hypothetical protein